MPVPVASTNGSRTVTCMVTEARGASHYKGYCLYSYSSVIMPASGVKAQVQAELTALSKIL